MKKEAEFAITFLSIKRMLEQFLKSNLKELVLLRDFFWLPNF